MRPDGRPAGAAPARKTAPNSASPSRSTPTTRRPISRSGCRRSSARSASTSRSTSSRAAVFNDTVYKNKDFDVYLDWQGFGVDPDIASRWSTSTADAGTYLSNPSSYSNPQVDEAFKAAEVAPTQEERQTYLWQAQELITADAPAVWLYLWEALSP